MTAAAELDRAAAKVRATADAADVLAQGVETISTHSLPEFANHMALWQPKVARAVADWLADRASTLRIYGGVRNPENEPALRLARLINSMEKIR